MENVKILYEINRENKDYFSLTAILKDGCLRLITQDFSSAANDMFGDYEYECYRDFDKENTNKLKKLLKTKDLLKGLDLFFNKEMKDLELYSLCEENNIVYSTFIC